MEIALIDLWRVVRAKGGTEKIFCDMSNILLKNGHEVTAVCCENNFGPPGFPIDPGVRFLNAWSQETPWWLSEKLRNLWSLSLSRKRRHLLRVKFNYARYGAKIRKALSHWGLLDVFICSQIEAGMAVRCAFGVGFRLSRWFIPIHWLSPFCRHSPKKLEVWHQYRF